MNKIGSFFYTISKMKEITLVELQKYPAMDKQRCLFLVIEYITEVLLFNFL